MANARALDPSSHYRADDQTGVRMANARALDPGSHYRADDQTGVRMANARALDPSSHYRADDPTGVRMGAAIPILTAAVAIEYWEFETLHNDSENHGAKRLFSAVFSNGVVTPIGIQRPCVGGNANWDPTPLRWRSEKTRWRLGQNPL